MSETGGKGAAASSRRAKESMRRPLAKRFYTRVGVGEAAAPNRAFIVKLDSRTIRTPAKGVLSLPTRALAETIAAEWAAQGDTIDPETMPFTKLANTAIDAVAGRETDVAADIVAYALRDALCYRAEAPRELTSRQAASWDPLLAWAEEVLGVRFEVTHGVMPVEQGADTARALRKALKDFQVERRSQVIPPPQGGRNHPSLMSLLNPRALNIIPRRLNSRRCM